MKIGIDAKWYFSGPPSGRVVVKNLVDNIIKQNTEHSLILFFKAKEKDICLKHFASNHNIKLVFVKGSINFFINITYLQKYGNRENLDIILYQNFIPIFPNKKIKHVAYIHDVLFLDYPEYFSTFENLVYRLIPKLGKKSSGIITISKSEKERIQKHINYPSEKIFVVYHGVNNKFVNKHDIKSLNNILLKYNLPANYTLYIGRINIRKNIPTLLKAISLTNESLVLIGKKEHKSFNLDKMIKDLNIEDRVFTLGFIPEQDLQIILSNAMIFCFPSFAEGFGLPPVEAFKAGIPVITTNSTSLSEICDNAALYFEPLNSKELAQKIDILVKNKDIREELILKGLERAEMFTWKQSAISILNILEKINR
ncbi:glycosyltransferase family 1 protein [Prolixibacteraceae bacterium Z1-6]|uniref:Glycosyltransferase family 1 protein n=1 Tax=Draconibacterium aestuarii TaxID=2998507 RepID=A0A9X3F3G6_9BACT|nr:glycosyltransferase family 1 protein [Prolixibacteraceae bacterium Z1-6]